MHYQNKFNVSSYLFLPYTAFFPICFGIQTNDSLIVQQIAETIFHLVVQAPNLAAPASEPTLLEKDIIHFEKKKAIQSCLISFWPIFWLNNHINEFVDQNMCFWVWKI